ncbi:CAP domain-containing protein [Buchananella hordeovulneris]|uniref:SCP domain-containing protein n=1 Tax=Buchananella hordeovulneris TaxID=52770 RepID=A0A1Q5PWR7_9ACTO|nr:CAP domain-containing protein [Buchananella hordeovulneris]OKL51946.1 hypothetical protein BSZ40_05550 [Buchananella hordeovulneris]
MLRSSRLLAALAVAAASLVASPLAHAAPPAVTALSAPEVGSVPLVVSPEGAHHAQTILDRVNQLRASLGLAPVARVGELDVIAQDWSEQMAGRQELSHRPGFADMYPGGWTRGSENVAMRGGFGAEDVGAQLYLQWENSAGHYANMVDPEVNAIGIGIAYNAADDSWYATQNFAAYPDLSQLTVSQQAAAPAAPAPQAPAPAGSEGNAEALAGSAPAAPQAPGDDEAAEPVAPAAEESAASAAPAAPAPTHSPGKQPVDPAAVTTVQAYASPLPVAAAAHAPATRLASTGLNVWLPAVAGAGLCLGASLLWVRRRRTID